jgi:hypothetical protein
MRHEGREASHVRLEVFYGGKLHHTERCKSAAEVLAIIPELLQAHKGCERILVWMGTARLFVVDCEGKVKPA